MNIFKSIILASALTAAAFSASSCYFRISDEAKKEMKSALELRLESSKQVYSETDSVVFRPGPFTSVSSIGGMDVDFILSDCEPTVSLFGTHITRDSVKVYVNDGRLIIDNLSPIMYDEHVRIYAPAVKEVASSGSGYFNGTLSGESVHVSNLGSGDINLHLVDVGNLDLSSSGSGDVMLTGKATEAVITMLGSGDLDALGFDATKISVSSHGSGDLIYKKDGETIRKK